MTMQYDELDKKRAERKAKHEAETELCRWQDAAGIVHDVMALLKKSYGVIAKTDSDTTKLDDLRRSIGLVSVHALEPVLNVLNAERAEWLMHKFELESE